jgi:hypothetical protein|tara:strand:- start:1004 stop:1882 length:879 start_codon:yes stop_codon:yes gene_type:complete
MAIQGVNLAQVAQQTLETLSAETPMLKAFTTDFSSDVANVGESVTTRIANAVTAVSAASGYAGATQTSVAKTITLDNHIHYTAKFTDLEIAKGGMSMLERTFVRPAVHAVVTKMVGDLLDKVVNANFSNVTAAIATNAISADDIADLAGDMTTLNVPRANRSLVVNPSYYATLAQDAGIQAAYAYGGSEAIRNNMIPKVHGFDVYEYSGLDANSENLGGFVCGQEALLLATRQPSIPENWSGALESVQDPESGLTIQLRNFYDGLTGAQYITATLIYGVAVGSNSLKRIKTA